MTSKRPLLSHFIEFCSCVALFFNHTRLKELHSSDRWKHFKSVAFFSVLLLRDGGELWPPLPVAVRAINSGPRHSDVWNPGKGAATFPRRIFHRGREVSRSADRKWWRRVWNFVMQSDFTVHWQSVSVNQIVVGFTVTLKITRLPN